MPECNIPVWGFIGLQLLSSTPYSYNIRFINPKTALAANAA